jgi:ethanolamine-phosphate cytidylyltransferase
MIEETESIISASSEAETGMFSITASGHFIRRSNFLTTSRILRIFASGVVEPKPDAKVVYVDGAFDLFHMGHIEFLKAAKKMGDYLIVGVHNDDLVNQHRGHNVS